jgi:hypothetical protein
VGPVSFDSAIPVSGLCILDSACATLYSASVILVSPACMEFANVAPIEISLSLFELGQPVPGLCCICVYSASHISAVENVLTLRTCSTEFCIPKLLWAQIVFSHSVCALHIVQCAALQICHGFCHATTSLGGYYCVSL